MAARGGLGKPCSGGHVRAGFLVPLPSLPACPPCFHSLVQDQGGLCTALHPESFGSPEPPPSPPAAWPTHPGGWEEGRQAVNGKAARPPSASPRCWQRAEHCFPSLGGCPLPPPHCPSLSSSRADILLLHSQQRMTAGQTLG